MRIRISNHFERWMYVFRNLDRLHNYPEQLQEKIFKKFFKKAELVNLDVEQKNAYEDSLKVYRDLNNTIDTAFDDGEKKGVAKGLKQGSEEGIEQGLEKGLKQGEKQKAIDIAINLLDVLDVETISAKTGLTVDEINKLIDELDRGE